MINKLIENDFLATFKPPMKLVEEDDESSGINIKEYINQIITTEGLNIIISDIEIHYVYHNSDSTFEHIMLNYGIDDLYIVLVINLTLKEILGYHILDLKEKYGLK